MKTTRICVSTSESETVLIVEPWANQLTMVPGSLYEITFFGPTGMPEISVSPKSIVVYGWSGVSMFDVLRDGITVEF